MSPQWMLQIRLLLVCIVVFLFILILNTLHWGEDVDRAELVLPPWEPMRTHIEYRPTTCAEHAVVTQLYSDDYLEGAMTLGFTLRKYNICAKMLLLYIPGQLNSSSLETVTKVGWSPMAVERVPPPAPRMFDKVISHFKDQFTKLRLWSMTNYRVILYLDADCLVLDNINEIFQHPGEMVAVGDVWNEFWPWGTHGFERNFNAGVMLLRPDSEVFKDMMEKMHDVDGYETTFAEQGFLNAYFMYRYHRLPYFYNGNLAIFQGYPKLWFQLRPHFKIIHYNTAKPMLPDLPGELRIERKLTVEPFLPYYKAHMEMMEVLKKNSSF